MQTPAQERQLCTWVFGLLWRSHVIYNNKAKLAIKKFYPLLCEKSFISVSNKLNVIANYSVELNLYGRGVGV
jgi:hypothetical protein